MKSFLGVVMALVLVRAQGRKASHGNCVDDFCLTVHTDSLDFNAAQKSCQDREGHLMTVRTSVSNSVISDLLTGYTGNFWIGLNYMKDVCTETTHDLKGYTWITGDKATNFTNWKSSGAAVCDVRCVSLSKNDPKWTERPCDQAVDGYLCEYQNTQKCTRLESESPVLYETPFGFSRQDLQDVPNASNATDQHLGKKYICFDGDWLQAPWNCEVYKGGCEHDCYRLNDTFFCTCPPGYKLEMNAVRCSKLYVDPCLRANCSQKCVLQGEDSVCQCLDGYNLEDDGKTCKHVDDCDNRLCPDENSYCVKIDGGFECRCKAGFSKEKDTCEDDDECFFGPCEHICNNTIGSYHCECSNGFKVSSEDRHVCLLYCPDMECPAVACDINHPHQCECPDGFILEERGSDYFCVDIDECEEPRCDQNCINTPGEYICSCEEGYRLVGDTKCVKTKGLSTTESISIFIPTSRSPPIETASVMSTGALLAIIVCTAVGILLTVWIVYCYVKCCGRRTSDKGHSKVLEQVTTEKYTKKLSIPNINYRTSSL